MDKTEKLKNLFDEWKNAHNEESDKKYNAYRIDNIEKSSFCYDGIVCEKQFDGLLFIGKESNIGSKHTNLNDYFWLKEVAYNHENPYLFGTRLIMITNAYENGNKTGINEKPCDVLKKTALINLNKRGGKSSASFKSLKKYTEKYLDKIVKEIEIINPKTIVICGVKDLFDSLIKDKIGNGNIQYIYLKHPSYRRIETAEKFV